MVKNGDTVQVELISSSDLDDAVTSTLTIGTLSVTYRVTTTAEDDSSSSAFAESTLPNTTKLQILGIFNALKNIYDDDSQEITFLNTLLTMIDSQMDDDANGSSAIQALQFLYDLTEEYLNDHE